MRHVSTVLFFISSIAATQSIFYAELPQKEPAITLVTNYRLKASLFIWGGELEIVKDIIDSYGNSNSTLLHLAVEGGHNEIVEYLLKHGVDFNAKDKEEETPLHVAAFQKHNEIVECLLKNGAAVNVKNKNFSYIVVVKIDYVVLQSHTSNSLHAVYVNHILNDSEPRRQGDHDSTGSTVSCLIRTQPSLTGLQINIVTAVGYL